ncbi:MAG: class I SAM-dependent methyltransferase [Verrucomicrobia bacterium]|nr:class I SAM-dependent methyltransferase [Verrucomicrobiota bacterium]
MSQPRSLERLRHHYEVEKELAAKLRASTREERSALFQKLYQELFERVTDHPRLTRRESPQESLQKVEGQMNLLRPFLKPGGTLVEIAPGDCRLGYAVCAAGAARVISVDISDQRLEDDKARAPAAFELVIYDGYSLDLPAGIADTAFSYQFLEHLHPDDVRPHFDMVLRLLKPGGWYVFDTPHRFSGPHDISVVFGTELVGFHFQEWTLGDMRRHLKQCGFSTMRAIKGGRRCGAVMTAAWLLVESITGVLPQALRKRIAGRLFQSVTVAAQKPL